MPGSTDDTHVLFETNRLRCRRLRPSDVDALLAVYGDADAMRWVGDGEPLSREACVRWVGVTEGNYRRYGYGMFALESRDGGGVAGFCGLVHPGGQVDAEVKYAFLRSQWGRGLASEAIPALLHHGASAHGLTRIIATVAPGNLASQRVLLRSGMQPAEPRRNEDGSSTHVFTWRLGDANGSRHDEPVR